MKHYFWTTIGLALALLVLGLDLGFQLDLFESFAGMLAEMEAYELDEFVIPSIILLVFAVIDFARFKKQQKGLHEKELIYKAMVQASDHILKNCLNQMLLIRMEAEDTEGFDPQAIELFDKSMQEALKQLDSLGQIDAVNEEKIGRSLNIKIFKQD